MNEQAFVGEFHGEKAIWLRSGRYEAALLPEIGGNLVAFRDIDKGFHFLREPNPTDMESFKERPISHGIPILFPPNRYEDGNFTLNSRQYSFPINEESTHNHIHGFFYNIPWKVADYGVNDKESYVIIEQNVDEKHSAFLNFPHYFHFSIYYSLNEEGLTQRVSIVNNGVEPMPCMLGFHTAINAPFSMNSHSEDYLLNMTIGERWELDSRMLPTGRYQELIKEERAMKEKGISPYFESMDNHYTSLPQQGRNVMILTDTKEQVKLIYDVGLKYKHWMIWNNKSSRKYFCPEPQINLVNAPNVNLPNEVTGLFLINPGECWTEQSRMYCEYTTHS
jgi:aldose 1-epimerase